MRRVVTVLAMLLLAPAAFGQTPPAGPPKPAEMKPMVDADKAKQAEADKKYAALIHETVKEGVELYNGGNYEGCLRLFQGSAMVLQVALDYRPETAKAIKDALAATKGKKEATDAAYVLRAALDKAQTDLTGGGKKATPAGQKDK